MRALLVFLLAISLCVATCGVAQTAPSEAPTITKAEHDAVVLVRRLLADPQMIPTMRGARLERAGLEKDRDLPYEDGDGHRPRFEYPRVRYRIFQQGSPAKEPLDQVSIRLLGSDAYDFMIFLTGEGADTGAQPDAARLAAELDAFAARYWPSATCVTDYSALFRGHRLYALREQEAEVFTVSLEYRPDGRIYRISTQDRRPALAGRPVPPPPTREAVFAAVSEALSGNPKAPQLVKFEPVTWRRSVMAALGTPLSLQVAFNLTGQTADDKAYSVTGSYDEATRSAWVEAVAHVTPRQPAQERPQRGAEPVEPSPVTVSDKAPQWSADGKRLFFITSRATITESRWSRKHAVFVDTIATCTVNNGVAQNLRALQPLKPFNSDKTLTFEACNPSPSGRFLALPSYDGLFLCDTQQAVTYWPQTVPTWRPSPRRWLPLEDEIAPETVPREQTLAWLPDEKGFLRAGYDGINEVRLTGKSPAQVTNRSLLKDREEFRLPCLSDSGSLLSFAHQKFFSEQWQFSVVRRDTKTGKLGVRRTVPLPDEPKSLTWHSTSRRWLIVTIRQAPLWVKDTGSDLTLTPTGPLKWENTALRVTGAAINPVNSLIVLSAELQPGRLYPQKRLEVYSSLFRWDGKSAQATPLVPLDVSGLPLGTFGNGKTWTTFSGDVANFRLQDYLDPKATRQTPQRQPFEDVVKAVVRVAATSQPKAWPVFTHPDNRRHAEALRLVLRGDLSGMARFFAGTPPTADEWEDAMRLLRTYKLKEAANAMTVVYHLGRISWRINNPETLRSGLRAWQSLPVARREPLSRLLLDLMRDDFPLRHAVAHTALDLCAQTQRPQANELLELALSVAGPSRNVFSATDVRELQQVGRSKAAQRLLRFITG